MHDEYERGSGQAKRWTQYAQAPADFLRSQAEHPMLLQVLYNRGLRTAREVQDFLVGEDAVVENPFRLRDMENAAARILAAIRHGETICVYGDFDADGVTSTALLVNALQCIGGRVGPYIPDRVDEGYGLNMDAITTIAAKAKLLITVDCGMRSIAEVTHARTLGMDVIVTDHHSIGPMLPPALAVINPRRADGQGGFERLAGVGVAYRVAQAVLRRAVDAPDMDVEAKQVALIEQELLDYVAVGTVADVMPLLGENRSLVRRGLAQLNRTLRSGVEALMLQADLRPGTVDTTAISFRLAPRINAAGRLAHAKLAYRLLRTNDPVEAYTLAGELEQLNRKRQALTEQAQTEAEGQVTQALAAGAPMLFVRSPNVPAGIVGLVAGRLVERAYRPAVVIEEGPEESRGSARSIPEFDISDALDTVSGLLVRHGGHSRAAGFTVKSENLPALQEALVQLAATALKDHDKLRPTLAIDAEATLDVLNWGLLEQLARLEPTGESNPSPLLWSRGVRVREARTVGNGKHMRLVVDTDPHGPVLDAIAFQHGEWAARLLPDTRVDLVYHLEANEWQGRRRLQLNVRDLRLAGSGPPPAAVTPGRD